MTPRVGIFPCCTDRSMPIVDLARAAEERGFAGIYLNEHTHIPVDHPRSSYPGGGPVPERYGRLWDPFVSLAFVAAATRLEVGTCVSLVGEHDAVALAKATATLDVLSGGRLLLGVGFGWLREEFEDHGRDARERAAVVEETVAVISALWRDDVAGFEGRHLRLSPSQSWPKPVSRPRPPVLLGTRFSERNLERVVEWADGWIPMGPVLGHPDFPDQLGRLRRRWEGAGRDPAALQVMALQASRTTESFRRALDRAEELGVQRVAVTMGDDDSGAALAILDRHAAAFAP